MDVTPKKLGGFYPQNGWFINNGRPDFNPYVYLNYRIKLAIFFVLKMTFFKHFGWKLVVGSDGMTT